MTATPRPWNLSHDQSWPWDLSIEPVGLKFTRAAYSTQAKTIEDVLNGVGFKSGEEKESAIAANAEQIKMLSSIVRAVNSHDVYLEALTKIAAFNDKHASDLADITGSYSAFDEPGSVSIARAALKLAKGEA